jgi:4'-phosphopantetheinyl transferase
LRPSPTENQLSLRLAEFLALRFNLSHSHQIALFAFGLDHDLGINIKEIRPQVAFEGIEGRYFLPNERAELEALPRGLRPGGFLPSLDLQRSLCKGQGLESFSVSLTAGKPAVLRSSELVLLCPNRRLRRGVGR